MGDRRGCTLDSTAMNVHAKQIHNQKAARRRATDDHHGGFSLEFPEEQEDGEQEPPEEKASATSPSTSGWSPRFRKDQRRNSATFTDFASDQQRAMYSEWYWPDNRDTFKMLRKSFLIFDKDGDGTIGPDELASVLNNLGENSTDTDVNRMLMAADDDNNGGITFDEFVKIMTGKKRLDDHIDGQAIEEYAQNDEARKIFDEVDADRSGYLNASEVAELCKRLGDFDIQKRHRLNAMKEMQADHEQGVSFKKFKQWWDDRKRHWTDRLVIPESLVYYTRRKARESNRLPPMKNDPRVMWQRLAVLLNELSKLTENAWGDARNVYSKQVHKPSNENQIVTSRIHRCWCWHKTSKVWTGHDDLSIAEERELEAEYKFCFLRPTSTTRQIWDGFQVPLLLYIFVAVPYRTAFNEELEPSQWMFWFEVLIDLYFLFDIVLNFRTAIMNESNGLLIIEQCEIAKRYATTWLLIDVASCLPVTYIALLAKGDAGEGDGSQFKAIKSLRMLRLAKMLRVLRVKRMLQRYDELIRPVMNGMKISGLSIAVIFIAHLVGCLWYLVGSDNQIMEDGTTLYGWTRTYGDWDDCDVHEHIKLTPNENGTHEACSPRATTWNQYLTSLYWAATTVTTVGYGDISASTDIEKIFAFGAMVFGVMIFALVSGSLTAIVMSSKAAEQVYYEKMDSIRQYLQAKKVPSDVRRKVITFYTTLWTGNAVYDEKEILRELPQAIKRQVVSHLYRDMIDSVRLFSNIRGENRDEILCKICLGLEHTVALANDCIMIEGEIGSEMYIIEVGEVDFFKRARDRNGVPTHESYPIGRLGPNCFFGELAVIGKQVNFNMVRKRTARAKILCQLSILQRKVLSELRRHYEELDEALFSMEDKMPGHAFTSFAIDEEHLSHQALSPISEGDEDRESPSAASVQGRGRSSSQQSMPSATSTGGTDSAVRLSSLEPESAQFCADGNGTAVKRQFDFATREQMLVDDATADRIAQQYMRLGPAAQARFRMSAGLQLPGAPVGQADPTLSTTLVADIARLNGLVSQLVNGNTGAGQARETAASDRRSAELSKKKPRLRDSDGINTNSNGQSSSSKRAVDPTSLPIQTTITTQSKVYSQNKGA